MAPSSNRRLEKEAAKKGWQTATMANALTLPPVYLTYKTKIFAKGLEISPSGVWGCQERDAPQLHALPTYMVHRVPTGITIELYLSMLFSNSFVALDEL
jgi:lambda repressor-like predicted transcriptional regulator